MDIENNFFIVEHDGVISALKKQRQKDSKLSASLGLYHETLFLQKLRARYQRDS